MWAVVPILSVRCVRREVGTHTVSDTYNFKQRMSFWDLELTGYAE